jgi:two-component system, cell cycle sensor histidine kinase and response regulator CckA
MTFLIVEDEQQVRLMLRTVLFRRGGFHTLEAHDAESALELMRFHQEISGLITDVEMPGMNGIYLAKVVRNRFPTMPILFLSGSGLEPDELERAVPGSGFLRKPFDLNTSYRR